MKIGLRTIAASILLAAMSVPTVACSEAAPEPPTRQEQNGGTTDGTPDNDEKQDDDMNANHLRITVGGRTFTADIADTAAAEKLAERLPLTLDMSELNGNEKYFYLDFTLPTASQRVDTMHEGDIMLWGSDCLVIFYKTFQSGYSYTRIGRITDTGGLCDALGSGSATVTFALGE